MAKTSNNPKSNLEHIEKIKEAWSSLAPTAIFGEMSLQQFSTKVQPSFDTRAEILRLEDELKAAIVARDNADAIALNDCAFVVKGVVASPQYGDNSGLYGAMGYKRKSEYKSGLTRKLKVAMAV